MKWKELKEAIDKLGATDDTEILIVDDHGCSKNIYVEDAMESGYSVEGIILS